MIAIKQFVFNPFQENTYVLYQPQGEAIVVDAGCSTESEFQELLDFVHSQNLTVKCLINTHCHIDHILGIDKLKKQFGVKAFAHIDDFPLLQMAPAHAMMFWLYLETVPAIDETLSHGDMIELNGDSIKVIHTPGHSRGGLCFYAEQERFILTGDTLFNLSIGRTDLAGGNYETLIKSIREQLMVLPDDVIVYPGHGNSTTIGIERASNPFL
ncbi:MAG: MBL fold metallo-hydrolase [Tenuifilum sp.]|jgi:glyoxylase-like metal-dependent hydrolase (beta-lactamase superfamily II)|uniref:MBL fold metallo-hydrolase n=1 Tax=Tenuifilum sp. TaxID=2760880 RepID=UPI001B489FF0|nr:MBL fold metallo-hydrolase [Bacteroidales bacterium]HOK59993.1 MBL fold metallo-hydrolase [Tenuifilum sp.]MBP9028452.1 MBL fold metallo-hydrolase [Bacteroidales bacterium]HOK84785.1 MBL fold metallo-hydrolase [Tenuifilum sp.]HON69443.1 MBL fold metallo-hydrolase [Tenuifilum sp.]